MLAKFAEKFGPSFTYRLVHLDGEPAVMEYSGQLFSAMYRVLNPEKLTHVA